MEHHIPVMLDDVIQALQPADKTIIDGTVGAGGHTRAMLAAGAAQVVGFDVDPHALDLARQTVGDDERVTLIQASYADMADHVRSPVDGILLDLGVSSMQLNTAERGFAFMRDGPLDMRFDPTGLHPPASELVNTYDEGELADIFYQYGEERYSRRIARAVVAHRPYTRTGELAAVIENAVPMAKREQHIHPATRTFQALRIAVNDELGTIRRALPLAVDLLRPGGRLAVISFHSLEDRIVKQTFKDASTEIVSPPGMVLEEKAAIVRLITRKPLTASDDEVERNPRSRSAKLRVVEKR